MKGRSIVLITLLSFSLLAASYAIYTQPTAEPKPLLIFPKGSTYDKEWVKVDSLTKKGLNRQALKVVEGIYGRANKDNNSAQIAKALIHRIVLEGAYEEEGYVNAIYGLQEELDKSYYPLTPVLHSIVADIYWNYYIQNRWRFYNRTETVGFDNTDIRTWDLKKLVQECLMHHQLALAQTDSLQRTPLGTFEDILVVEQKETRKLRPTLYDFLAHRAVDFYANTETSLPKPNYSFEISDSVYFLPAESFVKLKIESKDTLSMKYNAAKVLQGLTTFHLKDPKPDALVDIELKRLSFLKNSSIVGGKNALYMLALRTLHKRYYKNECSSEIGFAIANQYNVDADQYRPLESEDHKWDRRKAIALCDSIIKQYPKSDGAKNCKYLKSYIQQKSYQLTGDEVVIPNQESKALLHHRNVSQVYLRLCKISPEKYRRLTRKKYGKELVEELVDLNAEKEWSVELKYDGDFQQHGIEMAIPATAEGHYVLLAGSQKEFKIDKEAIAYCPLWISSISYVSRHKPDGGYDFTVMHRGTGQPIKGVRATLMQEKYNYILRDYEFKSVHTYTTDENGFFKVPPPSDYRYFYMDFKWGDDRYSTASNFYQNRPYNYDPKRIYTHFFTDRSIYRPGQTVHFKGIVIEKDGDKQTIVPNYNSTVYMYDVNYQEVGRLNLTSNDYGTFSGTFTAPISSLNGQMRIENNKGSVYFSVEEYKRPRFEVSFEPVEGSYKLNEDVTMKGIAKAYAGSSIDGATVQYRVVRNASFPPWCYYWRGYWPTSSQMEIAHGQATTNDTGEFKVEFTALPDRSVSKEFRPTYTYTVYADVTDINGETHSTQQYVQVGYSSLVLGVNVPDNLRSQSNDTFKISTTNLSGEVTPAKGTLTIHALQAPSKIFRDRKWARPDRFSMTQEEHDKRFPSDVYDDENNKFNWKKGKQVLNRAFDTQRSDELLITELSTWKPGYYVLEAKALDKDGEEVKQVLYFTLFDPMSKTAPIPTYSWFYMNNRSYEPGDTAEIVLASAANNVKVLYEIEHKDKRVAKDWIHLNKEQRVIRIPVEEKHRGNLIAHLTFVKDNRSYSSDPVIIVPHTDKKLDISFETFRDKLLPGQKEEWKVKLKGPKGEKVAAEMVAAMYDASLDVFKGHNWYFDLYASYYSRLTWQRNYSFSTQYTQMHQESWNVYEPFHYRMYDYLNWFSGYYYNTGWGDQRYREAGIYFSSSRAVGGVAMDAMVTEETESTASEHKAMAKNAETAGDAMDKTVDEDNEAMNLNMPAAAQTISSPRSGFGETGKRTMGPALVNVKARSNFSETAFFYPQLHTDENGEIVIKFTVPESLTKWKFMSLGHTKDLKYGRLAEEVVTQKELMVMPNAPRFFREGDKMIFSSKISNLSEKNMKGMAQLFFFDAVTMKPLDAKFITKGGQQAFEAKKGQSAVVSWELSIPEGMQAVKYKVVAQAGKFTDGEEMALPVLTNRMLVTESLPLPVRGKESKTFNFTKLVNSNSSSTLAHHKLTLEYTSNPAWYAVQAMPYMMEYPYECSEQVFTRYYANSLASHIANSNPKIKAVFERWKSQSPEAFLSNLEKNQELKSVMLKETPWVLDAQNESERKKRIGLLFDLNRMSNELARAMKKLQKAQSANGGWPWFPGMQESRYITQHIVTGMGHLDHLGVKDVRQNNRTWSTVHKAVQYLDTRIREDYDWLVKHKVDLDKNHLTSTQIQYLYARSYFKDIPVGSRNRKAFDYYKGQAKKYWLDNNRYMQGMIALGLHRYDEKQVPAQIIASLKDNALFSEEMGMYWKDNYNGYWWYQAPIESQALLIEAFDEVANDQKSVEEMKIWLLKSKQTQDWKTTKATVEACYALLLRGTELLASDELVVVQLGNMVVDPKKLDDVKTEAGTGYFKTSWGKGEIKPEWGKVKVTKNDEGVAWGALYWQYFEQLDKITPAETPLKLNKKLFLERFAESGPVITPVTDKTDLKPGDKLKVRIELRVDRDMEFVHMKDMRAAGFEPINVLSHYKWQDGLGYYESTGDAATNFFFDRLPKGTYVFEYPLRVSHEGDFSNGITSIQCMYAPEFTSHSEGIRVQVGK